MAAFDAKSDLMAAEVVTEIVSQKLEILLFDPVCVGCLSMQDQVKDTKAKLAEIQELLPTQYRQLKTTEWWRRLLRAMWYAEEFINKFDLREARKRHRALHVATRPLAALVSKYMLRRDLSYLVIDMDKVCQDKFLTGKKAEGKRQEELATSSHASVPWQGKKLARLTGFWDQQAPTNFFCHEAKKMKIMKQMKIKSMQTVWTLIWGKQGTGKTFLARWAYSQAKYMDYELRAWVHISASMDERESLCEILKQVKKQAIDMTDMKIDEIMEMLHWKLAKTKRFLIVLDDVRLSDMPLLNMLAFRAIPRHGHIIITTQDNPTAEYTTSMAELIRLEHFCNEESRRMLAWKLHRVPDGQRLLDKERDILNMCPCLPLCISLLGGFLSNAGEHELAVLEEEGSMMTLLDILLLSYHKLPAHLKLCFIYMALFPVGSPIPTRRLVRLWLAEGLLDSHCHKIERERKRLSEDVGESFILELADRNVIDVVSWREDGSPKACQMLTSLHDMIRPIMMRMGFIHIHATSKSKDRRDRDPTSQQQQLPAQQRERTKIRWVAEHTNIFTDVHGGNYPNLNLGHVRSFLSFYLRSGMLSKDNSTFLRKMTSKTNYSLLRVLDLEGVYKPSLHGVLHKLVLLRYLGLRCTVLDSLPSAVADLHYLETLDIKHTNITSLPSSIWKARNLRHLHLNWFYINLKTILKACSNNVMALTKLQTLSGLVVGEVKENLMRDHMDNLTTLKLFLHQSDRDTSGAAGKAVADWIIRLTNLQTLTFGVTKKAKPAKEAESAKEAKRATSQIGLLPELSLAHHELLELYLLGQLNKPIWKRLLPDSIRVLTLSCSEVETDMMPMLGGLLRNLRTLKLLANSFLCKSMRFIKDGFPSLKILKIWKLPHLQELIIEQGAMLHLKELEFRHLDAMQNVEGIKECKELENICVVVKKGADGFVDGLDKGKGETTNLCKIEETEMPEPTDDDNESDDDNKASASP